MRADGRLRRKSILQGAVWPLWQMSNVIRPQDMKLNRYFAPSLAVLLALAGCTKEPEPKTTPVVTPAPPKTKAPKPAPPPTPPEAGAAPTPTPETPPPASAIGEIQSSTELADLSKALNIFVNDKKRFPNTVTELAQYTPNGIPTLPAGYRYVIDRQSRQVLISK